MFAFNATTKKCQLLYLFDSSWVVHQIIETHEGNNLPFGGSRGKQPKSLLLYRPGESKRIERHGAVELTTLDSTEPRETRRRDGQTTKGIWIGI